MVDLERVLDKEVNLLLVVAIQIYLLLQFVLFCSTFPTVPAIYSHQELNIKIKITAPKGKEFENMMMVMIRLITGSQ
jgi:hypothetical protein